MWGGRQGAARLSRPIPPPNLLHNRCLGSTPAASHAPRPSVGVRRAGQDAGERPEGVQGGAAGEAQRRTAAALEEEALRPDGRRRPAAAAQAARPPAAAARRRRGRGARQGAALRQHEDGGLRGAEGQVRVLHGGHDRGEGDRLQVPAGRGLERGDHPADGSVQEPPGDPSRQVHAAEAAAAGGADARTQERPQRAQRGVTRRQRCMGRSAEEDHEASSPFAAAPSPTYILQETPTSTAMLQHRRISQKTEGLTACEKTRGGVSLLFITRVNMFSIDSSVGDEYKDAPTSSLIVN